MVLPSLYQFGKNINDNVNRLKAAKAAGDKKLSADLSNAGTNIATGAGDFYAGLTGQNRSENVDAVVPMKNQNLNSTNASTSSDVTPIGIKNEMPAVAPITTLPARPTMVAGVTRSTTANGTPLFSNVPQSDQAVARTSTGNATPTQTNSASSSLPAPPTPAKQVADPNTLPSIQNGTLVQPTMMQPATALPARPQSYQAKAIISNMTPDAQAEIQAAIERNVRLGQQDMTSGANRINAKYAHMQNQDLLANDVSNQGIQQRSNEQGQADAQFGQELAQKKQQADQANWQAILEGNQKAPYYASETALNNAQTQAALLPKPPSPEKWSNTQDANGNPIQVSDSGVMRTPKKSPEMIANEFQQEHDAKVKQVTDDETLSENDKAIAIQHYNQLLANFKKSNGAS